MIYEPTTSNSITRVHPVGYAPAALYRTGGGGSEYLNTRPRQVNFVSGQVDLQLTCPDGQVEILEIYQKYCIIFLYVINF